MQSAFDVWEISPFDVLALVQNGHGFTCGPIQAAFDVSKKVRQYNYGVPKGEGLAQRRRDSVELKERP